MKLTEEQQRRVIAAVEERLVDGYEPHGDEWAMWLGWDVLEAIGPDARNWPAGEEAGE